MPRPTRSPYIAESKGGNFEIRWTEGGRSFRRATGTGDRPTAEKILAHFIVLKDRGELEPAAPAQASVLIMDLLDTYRAEHVEMRVASKETADFILGRLHSFFGPMAVSDILPAHIDDYIAQRRCGKIGKGAKDSTIERDLSVLRAAINYAVRRRRITSAMTPYIENLASSPPKERWLRREEADALLAAARMEFCQKKQAFVTGDKLPRVYKFIAIGLATAARRSAILELTRDQIDMVQRRINFNPPGRVQTKKRRVAVPISDWLLPIMQRIIDEAPREKTLLGAGAVRTAFEGAVERAGLVDVTPHTLRHTWACWAAQAGVSLYEIAGVLGDTLTTVQANYLHHCPDHLRDAVNFDKRAA
jgi:integrase